MNWYNYTESALRFCPNVNILSLLHMCIRKHGLLQHKGNVYIYIYIIKVFNIEGVYEDNLNTIYSGIRDGGMLEIVSMFRPIWRLDHMADTV